MAISHHIQRWAPTVATFICIAVGTLIWVPSNRNQLAQDAPATSQPNLAEMPNAKTLLASGAEELVTRPLFHVTRRPPTDAVPAPQAAPAELTLSLTGILNSDDVQIALMRLSNSPELLRGRIGDQIGPWRIVDITQTAVTVLSDDGGLQLLNLTQVAP